MEPGREAHAWRLVEPDVRWQAHYLRSYEGLTEVSDRVAWVYLGEAADLEGPKRDFAGYVATLARRRTVPPPRFVCDTVYWALSGEEMVGRISLRHELNEFLREVGGHIGYVVHPAWRNRGVATWMLGEVLRTDRAREIGRLLLTCDEDNLASEKTIRKNGGLFERLVDLGATRPPKKHFWIDVGRPPA